MILWVFAGILAVKKDDDNVHIFLVTGLLEFVIEILFVGVLLGF